MPGSPGRPSRERRRAGRFGYVSPARDSHKGTFSSNEILWKIKMICVYVFCIFMIVQFEKEIP